MAKREQLALPTYLLGALCDQTPAEMQSSGNSDSTGMAISTILAYAIYL